MRTLRLITPALSLSFAALSFAALAAAQEPAPPEASATQSASQEAPVEVDPELESAVATDPSERTGFTTGLRLGIGVPLGKAGQPSSLQGLVGASIAERNLSDLTPWRAPVWVDVGYSLSGAFTIGAYGQVGVGGTGDACIGDCDWSDIRVGAQVEWRLAPGAPIAPWLGAGLGYEWLSYRQLVTASVPGDDGTPVSFTERTTEHFGGPELLLQGGIDFQVEDALRIGPYASATLAQYVTESYSCQQAGPLCPDDGSIDGAAFHSWIGVGVRGAYTP